MISLETAKALKKAGLPWEPKMGDWYYFGDSAENQSLFINPSEKEVPEGIYFAPRLDQLLAEIEKRGYDIDLMHFAINKNNNDQIDDPVWSCEVNKFLGFKQVDNGEPKLIIHNKDGSNQEVNVNKHFKEHRLTNCFDADSPDEAAAQALLWILKEGK